MYLNEQEIRKTIAFMKPNNALFEIRVIGDGKPSSGYFREVDTAINELKRQNLRKANVYITLNEINAACYDRSQKDVLRQYSKASTSDNDISGYDWLMVDLDPVRPTDTSSTDEQIELAKKAGNEVFKFMSNIGFERPLCAFSGNGVHLLYKVFLKSDESNKSIIQKCLKVLVMKL